MMNFSWRKALIPFRFIPEETLSLLMNEENITISIHKTRLTYSDGILQDTIEKVL